MFPRDVGEDTLDNNDYVFIFYTNINYTLLSTVSRTSFLLSFSDASQEILALKYNKSAGWQPNSVESSAMVGASGSATASPQPQEQFCLGSVEH